MNPQTLNRYLYVLNNPARLVDPYGYFGWDDIADRAGDFVEGAGDLGGKALDTCGDVVEAGVKSGEWFLEKMVIPGDCFKMAAATALLGSQTVMYAALPLGLSGTGVGAPVTALVAAESGTAAVAAGVSTYYVGKSAWDICTARSRSEETYRPWAPRSRSSVPWTPNGKEGGFNWAWAPVSIG
jgi:hypothetical protein